jgi:phage terminase large subunit
MLIEWTKKITLAPYLPLYETDAKIIFIWGGRDSGKSFAMPQILTRKALMYKGFRCMLVRKQLNTVKSSMFDRFYNFFDTYKLNGIVSSTKTPLEINVQTGADFLGRGCDDPAKLKSTTDPSDAWIEEADQISEDDFDIIMTTLRSNDTPVQCWLTFNPEVAKDGKSWIKERFFKDLTEQEMYKPFHEFYVDVHTEKGTTQIKCLSIHTTCEDNPYADASRIALYDSYKERNINKYNVWRHGWWGYKEVNSPFAWAFDEDKHVRDFDIDFDLPIDLSFDFNVVPCTATISQQDNNRTWKRFLYEIRLGTTDKKANVYHVCQRIKDILPDGVYLRITGDASGSNKSALVYDNLDAYDIIQKELNISDSNVWTPKSNPRHEQSYFEFNDRLTNREVYFHSRMMYSIEDLKQVEYANKSIQKKEAESKGMGHLLDCLRYDINTFFY